MIWLGVLWFVLLIIGLLAIVLLIVQFGLDLMKKLEKKNTDYYIHCIKPTIGKVTKVIKNKRSYEVEAIYRIQGQQYTVSTYVKSIDKIEIGKRCEIRYNPKNHSQAYFVEMKG